MDAAAVAGSLSLSEKASLLAGSGFWHTAAVESAGIPELMVADGPHGLRKQTEAADNLGINASLAATAFPTASAAACSFDPGLIREMGRALGEECRAEDVSVLLGPGVNIKRSPLCGRNFEYFSEDPLVAGILGAAWIEGVQSVGVGASLKHFAANNQERARMVVDSVVDERALNEVYLRPFEIAVRAARPLSVMTAYNRLNGVYCSQNEGLIAGKLRGEWGFDGLCVTDWGALSESVPSVAAGLDLCMPGPRPDHADAVLKAVGQGSLSASDVDRAARNVLKIAQAAERAQDIPYECDFGAHFELARRMAAQSAVLLENDGLLPLDRSEKVAVIGAFAMFPRYQGAGSSKIVPVRLDDAWSAFCDAGMEVEYARGYDVSAWDPDEDLIAEAVETAARCDACVVFAGLPDHYESEGFDRNALLIPLGHRRLIERVCRANPRTAVVLMGGSPMELPWRAADAAPSETAHPAAVLLAYLGGCAGGHALVDCLTGRVNPSGKLAETWPRRLEDTACGSGFGAHGHEVLYRESIFVGYRYFDSAGIEPAYPFGYGLSYTEFSYSGLSIERTPGGLTARCSISNDGAVDGAEAVQIYVHALDSTVFAAQQQLAGFAKVFVASGQTCSVSIPLDMHAFAHWDAGSGSWRAMAGSFEVRASASSRDVRLRCTVVLSEGEAFVERPDALQEGLPATVAPRDEVDAGVRSALEAYYRVTPGGFDDASFSALYGRPFPQRPPVQPFTVDTVVRDIDRTFAGRQLLRLVDSVCAKLFDEGSDLKTIMDSMLDDTPLRTVAVCGVSYRTLQGAIDVLNGNYRRGFSVILGKEARKELVGAIKDMLADFTPPKRSNEKGSRNHGR